MDFAGVCDVEHLYVLIDGTRRSTTAEQLLFIFFKLLKRAIVSNRVSCN